MKSQEKRKNKALTNRKILALRLRALRREADMTQTELAEKLGVKRTSVSNWEHGERFPDSASVEYMSRLFGVPTDYLYGISNHRYNINIPDYFELDLTKLNNEGMYMIYEYYKLLLLSDKYRSEK